MKQLTKKSRVTLVEPCPTQFGKLNGMVSRDFYSLFRVPPRALPTLTGVLKQEGWEKIKMISPFYHGVKDVFSSGNYEDIFSSDAVLVSPILRTASQAFELTDRVRSVNKNINLLAGGMDASYRIDEYLKHFDIVVVGEGEKTVSELMERLTQDSENLENIAGVATQKNRNVSRRELMSSEELSALPNPVYDDAMRAITTTGVIEQERGCPHDCPYCLVTQTYGNIIRPVSTKKVLSQFDELDYFKKLRSIMFTGDNLAGAPKEALELMEGIKNKFGTGGIRKVAQVSSALAYQPKLMKAMRDVNIFYLCAGFESVNDISLGEIGKPFKAKQNTKAAKRFRENGFWTNAMMMVGTDADDIDTIKEITEWCKEHVDSMQLFILTPLPGTRYYNKMKSEGRILTDKSYLYDAQNCVIQPAKMSAYDLQIGVINAYKDFYSMKSSLSRLRKSPDKKFTLGISAYVMGGGLNRMLLSPQTKEHLEFLKKMS
jgi:radical SAM superfamily enzyme YgiQ (UPF0313 family)